MNAQMIGDMGVALWQTLYMVLVSSLLATLVGLPIGVWLYVKQPKWLGFIINAMRSVPYIILMVAVIPLTQIIVGTTIGTTAAIVPLVLAAFPFLARVVESALREVSAGLIEAARSMGASTLQVIIKVLLAEARSSIIRGVTLTVVTLVGYSAMAGAVGGGGLGDLAIRYGYERFNVPVMVATVVILIVVVQGLQWIGDVWARKYQV